MENSSRNEPRRTEDGKPSLRRTSPNIWVLLLFIGVMIVALLTIQGERKSTIQYSFFLDQIRDGNVLEVQLGEAEATGEFKAAPDKPPPADGKKDQAAEDEKLHKHFRVVLPRGSESRDALTALLDEEDIPFGHDPPSNTLMMLYMLVLLVPLALFAFFWFSYRRTRDQMLGGGFLSGFSKSPAKRYEAVQQPVTFADVAGLEGVKADLMEVVEYLSSPEKFQRLGGRVPKGVLLNGSPGSGKTLLARAVAGEANVPFYSISGSEFIQMFVGVGASRVRDLFKTAKDNSPSIIFIDEIDAVGRQRGAGLGGGHDEREQTLNQILSEMDGFTPNDSAIVLASTNRPDVLDPALLRPGRFDRHVTVDRPTLKGRLEIFNVHVRDVPLSDDVDLSRLAAATVGLNGADIRNLVNEAALWAARQDKQIVEMSDFDYARDKVLMGAKREEVLSEEEQEKSGYHEAGHTLVAWHSPSAQRVHKVTIIPRGRTLGATHTVPSEDRLSISQHELRDQLVVLLGGRTAEQLIYQETTAGAENDLEQATNLARRMVTHWGMSERLGPVSYKTSDDDPFLGREMQRQRTFSEHTQELIDEEVTRILREASQAAEKILTEQREDLERLTRALLKSEELNGEEITELIGAAARDATPK
ncbi:MAG: ATP-dependent zinc metalloprotease FtsH [Planctomycetota bacterium]